MTYALTVTWAIRKNISNRSYLFEIDFGRFSGLRRQDRICKVCSIRMIQSEYHFLLCCPRYSDIRTKYFRNTSWPSLHMFSSIMSSSNTNNLIKLAKYIDESMKIRKETLELLSAS